MPWSIEVVVLHRLQPGFTCVREVVHLVTNPNYKNIRKNKLHLLKVHSGLD
jgi:hypothetical protein